MRFNLFASDQAGEDSSMVSVLTEKTIGGLHDNDASLSISAPPKGSSDVEKPR
jgi:hypothetical protein